MGLEALSSQIDVGLLYLTPSVAATIATFVAGVVLLDRSRRAQTLRPFAVALLAEAVWSAAIVAEISARSLEAKVAWDSLQLPAIFVTSLGLFEFSLRYTGRSPVDLRSLRLLLAVIPVGIVGWLLTDPLHHQARLHARLIQGVPHDALVYPFTPLDVLSLTYALALTVAAGVLLGLELFRQSSAFRLQTFVLLLGTLAPLIPAGLLFAGVHLFGQRDTSPIVLCAAALLVVWALSSRGLFRLVPIARDVVFARIPDAVVVVDAEDRILDANPAALALMAQSSVPGRMPISEALGSVDLGADLREVELSQDGHPRFLSQRVASLHDERSARVGRVVVLTDVTRRVVAERDAKNARDELEARVAERTRDLARANDALKREIDDRRAAEVALIESERRFRAVFHQTFQLIGIVALDGTLLRMNQTALSFAGAGAQTVEGSPFWETCYWSHSPALQARLRTAIAEAAAGQFVRFEATHPDAEGVEHIIDFSIKPVVDDDGVPVLLVAEGRDVTDEKRAEAARMELEVQLLQVQKMESLGRLAGGVAHDFNNLLTAIMGNASLIERRAADTPGVAGFAHNILQAAESAAELTRQLLTFSRRQVIDRKVHAVDALVARSAKLLERIVGADVEIVLIIAEPDLRARIDAGQIEQAIVNLAVNARDAMPDGGLLTIEVDRVDLDADERVRLSLDLEARGFVVIRVRDTGGGILPEVQARMFEPFFTTKDAASGTGLGLAMVFGAMRQNDGAVTVAASSPEGSTFELLLPLAEEKVDAPRASSGVRVTGGTETVVVVEDQAFVRDLTMQWLTDLGYRVRGFPSAEVALEALGAKDRVDLLLTDVVLGGLSGRLLAERLLHVHPDLRVLFISGYHEDVALERIGGGAAVRFLSKPFTVEQLGAAVRQCLDQEAEVAAR